jgi:hypothetical protein
MSYVKVTLAVGIALTIAVGAVTLTHSPPRVVRVNEAEANVSLGVTQSEPAVCQANEVLPAGVSAIRLSIDAFFGAKVHLIAYHGSQIVTEGTRAPTWTGTSVTVPVKPVSHTTSHVELCFALAPNDQLVIIPGHAVPPRDAATALRSSRLAPNVPRSEELTLKGRVLVEYLTAGKGSWWSRARSVARHMGIGHFISGPWVALLAAALMAAVGILTVALTLREQT